jgi:hypothetical protein
MVDRYNLEETARSILAIVAIIFLFVGMIFASIFLVTFVGTSFFNGQKESITGTVVACEQKTVFGEHTDVTFQTLGETRLVYTYIGYHNFTVGQTYTITCIDRAVPFWFGPFYGYMEWGEIQG